MEVHVRRHPFRISVVPGESGWYVVRCLDMPGCISQGKTRASAVRNIKDAILGFLESMEAHNEPLPWDK
ncbi:MAG TPA: type II toxin-antitoxin system HicB family antitoxin [Candidatus Binatia bacterium]|nr:type II toxin-antitoxin system HicB family antitoxin [Candidatus Binatia bacterium]